MAGRGTQHQLLLTDANVIIDYVSVDIRVLTLCSEVLGPVAVPLPIVSEELRDISENTLSAAGIEIIEPTLQQVSLASSQAGRLAANDVLCFLMAEESSWTCVTNDGALRMHCKKGGVPTMRGLRLLIELRSARRLSLSRARRLARTIVEQNRWPQEKVLAAVLKQLEEA